MSSNLHVRIVRTSDRSVTFKGPMVHKNATRELAAWVDAGMADPISSAITGPTPELREELRAWKRATKAGGRFYPSEVGS